MYQYYPQVRNRMQVLLLKEGGDTTTSPAVQTKTGSGMMSFLRWHAVLLLAVSAE